MEKVNWGSIGCGDVMEVKSGPAMQNVEHSDLVAVMRRDAGLAKDFAQRHKVGKWYDQAVDLVNDSQVNAIYIATPPDSHLEYTRLAAQAGKPVYVEKPMANSYSECLEMIEVCGQHQVPLYVAYYRRALPRFLKVKDILDSGVLGTIHQVEVQLLQPVSERDIAGESNWRVDPTIAGCGYFCDLGSHIFDLLQFLLGDIIEASGTTRNIGQHYAAEDLVETQFIFERGIQGVGIWNFNHDLDVDRTIITGSHGSVAYTHFGEGDVSVTTAEGNRQFDIPNPLHIQQPLIQLITDELRGMGTCPSTGESGAKTNWVIDQILGR